MNLNLSLHLNFLLLALTYYLVYSKQSSMSETNQSDILKNFKLRRIIWPILIGFGIVGYLLYREIDKKGDAFWADLEQMSWTAHTFMWIGLGFLMMVVRDFAYMWRMRVMTNREMSWRACFEVTLLWEFASAASPSVVGGAAVAVFMFIKEKISPGRSTAIVFVTIFLDELFYLFILPMVVLLVGADTIFQPIRELDADGSVFGTSLFAGFWIAYSVIFVYVVFLAIGLFFMPKGISRTIKRLFTTRLLKRWKRRGFKTADELLLASEEFNRKSVRFWLEAGAATFMAWMGRYLVLNCVLAAFITGGLSFAGHVEAFARQAVLFVVMLISPTPGSSGIAEITFNQLFADIVTPVGIILVLATIWRLISYYPYLFIGIPILPRWLKRVYGEQNDETISE